jgi:hypothetical protein
MCTTEGDYNVFGRYINLFTQTLSVGRIQVEPRGPGNSHLHNVCQCWGWCPGQPKAAPLMENKFTNIGCTLKKLILTQKDVIKIYAWMYYETRKSYIFTHIFHLSVMIEIRNIVYCWMYICLCVKQRETTTFSGSIYKFVSTDIVSWSIQMEPRGPRNAHLDNVCQCWGWCPGQPKAAPFKEKNFTKIGCHTEKTCLWPKKII